MLALEVNDFDFWTEEGGIEVAIASSQEFDMFTEEGGVIIDMGGLSGEVKRPAQIF